MLLGDFMQRLQKAISSSGYTSRRNAEKLIEEGKVCVNGNLITQMGYQVNGEDIITINGEEIRRQTKKVYYILNKPRGVISSLKDEHQRKTVVDLIQTNERIYPIGRLDYDTTGLILLTNDGEFANLLMHPKNSITKTYLAKIDGILDKSAIDKLKKGIIIDKRKVEIVSFKVKRKDLTKNTSIVQITIKEGRNHIVKNIFKELGYNVDKLVRTEYGFLTLNNLKSGEYRELTIKEIKRFYSQKNNK